eukprot:365743-Chlamydomonas_euryale.AAC.28
MVVVLALKARRGAGTFHNMQMHTLQQHFGPLHATGGRQRVPCLRARHDACAGGSLLRRWHGILQHVWWLERCMRRCAGDAASGAVGTPPSACRACGHILEGKAGAAAGAVEDA